MRNFADFVNTNIKDETKSQPMPEGFNQDDMKGYESLINNFSNLNEQEKIQEFLRLTEEGRRNGTINKEKLEKLSQTLSPMLNENQKKMLTQFLNYMK